MLRRCARRVVEDRLLDEAAAVAFYALLAIFPTLAALVTLCGVFVDPEAAASLQALADMLPAGTAEVAREALGRSGAVGGGRIGLGAILAAAALWSGTAAALLFALGAMAFATLALRGVLAVPLALGAQAGPGGGTDRLLHLLRWPLLVAAVAVALALTYRHGPRRACPRWQCASWGGVVAAPAWLLGSVSVSSYMEHVGGYDWLYGSVGAVLGFMLWAWVSSAAVLVGAVLNAELEHQAMPEAEPTPPRS